MAERKDQTNIITRGRIKSVFKMECTKNGVDMSEVTEALWKQYIVSSVQARKERYKSYNIESNGEGK